MRYMLKPYATPPLKAMLTCPFYGSARGLRLKASRFERGQNPDAKVWIDRGQVAKLRLQLCSHLRFHGRNGGLQVLPRNMSRWEQPRVQSCLYSWAVRGWVSVSAIKHRNQPTALRKQKYTASTPALMHHFQNQNCRSRQPAGTNPTGSHSV